MAEFHVSLREQGGNFAVQFRTEPGLPSDVTELDVTANGRYDAGEDAAFNPVVVNVPNSYTEADEGKVVSNGELVEQTAHATVTENGTIDTTLNNSVTVVVPIVQDLYRFIIFADRLFRDVNTISVSSWVLPETVKMQMDNVGSLYMAFAQYSASPLYARGPQVIELDMSHNVKTVTLAGFAQNNLTVTRITFFGGIHVDNANMSAYGPFDNATSLETIMGEIDLSAVTSITANFARNASLLRDISFKHDSIKVSFSLYSCSALSDASLVSIANGLDGTVTGQTLTLHATPKATCQTLMGTVTDGDFTQDESGTVTLADFITTIKGWTLA